MKYAKFALVILWSVVGLTVPDRQLAFVVGVVAGMNLLEAIDLTVKLRKKAE